MMTILDDLAARLAELDLEGSLTRVMEALSEGHSASEILAEGLSKGMEEVGQLFEKKEYFIADLVAASHIVNEAMELLKEKFREEVSHTRQQGRVVFGTVEGDLHDIGKNIAISLLTATGFEVHDLGVDVPATTFVEKVRELEPDIVAMSALLLTTLPGMGEVIEALKEAGLRRQVYIMVGGRPTNAAFAKQIGADAYCVTAMEGLAKANAYMERKNTG
jgi:corrinoid protein of di/trimethylamine methyltransferase